MSALREALEFIEDWVQKNMPEHPSFMQQGLSQEEIEDKIKNLPFQLSEEVYELYKWRNGGEQPFIPEPWAGDLARFLSNDARIGGRIKK